MSGALLIPMNLLRPIPLPGGRTTTSLGFGCAGLMRLPTAGARARLLRAAFDAGITHFDVARMYGDGLAEGFLGNALRPVRGQVTIATKFGLPYTQASGSGGLKSLAKYVMHRTGLRGMMKKILLRPAPPHEPGPAGSAPQATRYTAAAMEESLAISLARLQTERVDLFFLHEPGRHDILDDDLAAALERKKTAGQIGAFGISCGRAEADIFLRKRPELCGDAMQHAFDVFDAGGRGEPVQHACTGLFGVLAGAMGPVRNFLAVDRAAAKTWSDRLGLDLTAGDNLGIVILATALALNPRGYVLFSTTRPGRLRAIVRRLAENDFTTENLLAFRDAARGGLHAG